MLSREEFIRVSIEINLFFQRIMKEHLFFIETNLKPVEADRIQEADILKQSFEDLLSETVMYANGIVSEGALKSNEFVTPFTLDAEEVTMKLTGASLNTSITLAELQLTSNTNNELDEWLENRIRNLNDRSLNLLEEVIAFQTTLIALVSECKVFIGMYPQMLIHITHEAMYYKDNLESLQQMMLPKKTFCEELNFWNNIMHEHAEFIDGLLDPTEETLKETAEKFSEVFKRLVEECIKVAKEQILNESLEATEGIKEYKKSATEGLLECKIKSIIPPLLADHVLREANHYYRLLELIEK